MKKIKLALVLLLALTLALFLFSCGEDKPCEHADADGDGLCDKCGESLTPTGGGEDGEGDSVELIKDGEFKFQIVKGNDVKVETVKVLDKFVDMLKRDFGIELKVVGDNSANAVDCELLIGTVGSRGEQYKYNKYSLGKEGYAFTAIDGKVIVTAGGDEALVTAVEKFIADILGIDEDTESIGTVVFDKDSEVLKVQDNYRVTDVTVGGESIRDYKIVIDASVNTKFRAPMRIAAVQLQTFFYEQVGIYLDIVNSEDYNGDGNTITLLGVKQGKAGLTGFRTKVEGKSYIIECAHSNKFEEAFTSFYNKTLAFARDDVLALKKYESDVDITKVYYSDFGAVGDGRTDDYQAIKEAHDFANEGGQTVYASAGKSYYLNNIPATIYIKTNVDWMGCKIIIDDTNVTVSRNTNTAGMNVLYDYGAFKVVQDVDDMSVDADSIAKINATRGDDGLVYRGLESGENMTTNIGYAPGFPAVVQLRNNETYNYLRYGYVDALGSSQREIVLVDKDGNIDPSTPLLHDYTAVTSAYLHVADTTPITIKDATIESRASHVNLLGGYYSIGRGISISRANVTLDSITHVITGEFEKNQPVRQDANGISVIAEGYRYSGGKIIDATTGNAYTGNDIKPFTGHSYGGIVSVSNTHNTLVKNCVFQARVYYEEGTYDIGASLTNKIVFENCTQSNFFEPGTTKPNMGKCWGVAGTNYCKNMEYINSKLTRYDAHSGVTNGKIIGGELAVLRLIGGGDFIMEGVKIWCYNGTPFQLREDYGASFNGTVTLKDVDIVDAFGKKNASLTSLFSVPSSYWDMGYKTFMPNIVIDNLDIETSKSEIYLIGKGTSNMNYDASHHYPYRDIITKDPSDPTTAGYKFHYETSNAEAWVAENITAEGARFHGCEYTVYDHGGTATVVVTDVRNQYLYYAPDFIRIVNNSDKSYKIALYDCAFLRKATLDAERGTYVWVN